MRLVITEKSLRRQVVKYFPDVFLRYLIDNKALDKYLDNIVLMYRSSKESSWIIRLYNTLHKLASSDTRPEYLEKVCVLFDLFDWEETPEGRLYWQHLYYKYG